MQNIGSKEIEFRHRLKGNEMIGPNAENRRICIIENKHLLLIISLYMLSLLAVHCDALTFGNLNRDLMQQSRRLSFSHTKTSFVGDIIIWKTRRQSMDQNENMLTMGKGDGKKKRKKKSSSSAAPTPEPAAPAPLRVTNNSNISVKRQIRWAKMKKEYQNSGTAFRQQNVRRTSYRKSLGK